MNQAARIFIAVCTGLITAGVVAVCSYRMGLPHIIPGCLIGFGMNGITTYVYLGRIASAWRSR